MVYPRPARQTDGSDGHRVSHADLCVHAAAGLPPGRGWGGGSFSLSSLPGEPTHGLSLTSWHVPSAALHNPWPTSSDHGQSGRPQDVFSGSEGAKKR